MNNYFIMNYQDEIVFDYGIDDFVKEKQQEFLEEFDGDKNSSFYTLLDFSTYHDIVSMHYTYYVYQGGAHDIRMDRIYYWSLQKKSEVFLADLVTLNEEFLRKLSDFSYDYLNTYKKELIYDDDYMVRDGLKPIKENFQYLVFDEDSLKIVFPPYQVGPWSSKEIIVAIPYLELASYLKI